MKKIIKEYDNISFLEKKKKVLYGKILLFSKHRAVALFFSLHLLSANSEIISPIGQWYANVFLFKRHEPWFLHL